MLKTITICDDQENPIFSLCPGHVDVDTFNQAHEAEGWSGDRVEQDRLSHDYWTQDGDTFKRAEYPSPEAKPYTVMEW